MNQVHISLWRFTFPLTLLLEGVQHNHYLLKLHRVYSPKCIAFAITRKLYNISSTEPLHRSSYVWMLSLLSLTKSISKIILHIIWHSQKVTFRRRHPQHWAFLK